MADTKQQHAVTANIEGDGVSYRGIVVFVVILAVTVIATEIIVAGFFKYFQATAPVAARAPLAAPAGTMPPPPNLLTNEPANLATFVAHEQEVLETYGWQDKNAGTVRLPIERAMELALERGFPVRGAAPAPAEAAKPAEVKK